MKTKSQLDCMEEHELVTLVLTLQNELQNLKVCQHKSALIHTYHFSGNEMLTCNRDRMLGSGVILAIYDLSGKTRVSPVMLKDGLSNETINSLLNDMQYSFDNAVSYKPIEKRL